MHPRSDMDARISPDIRHNVGSYFCLPLQLCHVTKKFGYLSLCLPFTLATCQKFSRVCFFRHNMQKQSWLSMSNLSNRFKSTIRFLNDVSVFLSVCGIQRVSQRTHTSAVSRCFSACLFCVHVSYAYIIIPQLTSVHKYVIETRGHNFIVYHWWFSSSC